MSQSSEQTSSPQVIEKVLQDEGFEHFGFTPLGQPLSLDFYRDWLNQGLSADMQYLHDHLPMKGDEKTLLPAARSAIVVGEPYYDHPYPVENRPFPGLRIAQYANGVDYHFALKEKLDRIIARLKEKFPDDVFLSATDSSPILERDLAFRAGLGWFGKNTCLIDQKRESLFLIGEILTSLELYPAKSHHADRCGTCTRCIDACPTQAIIANRKLDAKKCISYWTIEAKTPVPLPLREKFHDWFFGCDICQTVCPWNEKAVGPLIKEDQKPVVSSRDEMLRDIQFILGSSKKEIERLVRGLPMARSRGVGLKRNAILLAGNFQLVELKSLIEAHLIDPKLTEIAAWALDRFTQRPLNNA